MDCKPSGIRRKGVLARGGTWAEARPTRRSPWTHRGLGAPLPDTYGQAGAWAKACVKTPHPTTRARLPRREDKSSGALERTVQLMCTQIRWLSMIDSCLRARG